MKNTNKYLIYKNDKMQIFDPLCLKIEIEITTETIEKMQIKKMNDMSHIVKIPKFE